MDNEQRFMPAPPGAEAPQQPAAPVTYTLDGRAFVVQPVFREKPAHTLSDALSTVLQQMSLFA